MALATMGTTAQTTLSALKWNSSVNVSDLALLNALIKQQGSRASTMIQPLPTVSQGGLYVPSRGHWRLYEGDYLAVDPVTGEVIVVNAASAAGASWVHT